MIETKSWKAARGLAEDGMCRVCYKETEPVEHLLVGCKVLANAEYLARHNRALMILAITWAKEHKLSPTGFQDEGKTSRIFYNDHTCGDWGPWWRNEACDEGNNKIT